MGYSQALLRTRTWGGQEKQILTLNAYERSTPYMVVYIHYLVYSCHKLTRG